MKTISTLFLLILSIGLNAQTNFAQLNIGDKLPDISVKNVQNYKSKELRLSDLKGKLIILDFWNRYCIPCINAFPKMEELQNKFGDKIQIVLVTSNSMNELKSLYDVSTIMKKVTLPTITSDTLLRTLFPHVGLPYHAWIDKNGVVVHTSAGYNTTAENIQDVLDNKKTNILTRTDVIDKSMLRLNYFDQLKRYDTENKTQIESYSIITKRSLFTGQSSRRYAIRDDNMKADFNAGSAIFNNKIVGMFTFAYVGNKGLLHIKTIVEPKNQSNLIKYFPLSRDPEIVGKWGEENTYCYEVKIKDNSGSPEKKFKKMQMDLEFHFNVDSRIEKRNTKCYVLEKITDFNIPLPNDTISIYEKTSNNTFALKNQSIAVIVQIIEDNFADFSGPNEIPVINETEFLGKIDAEITIQNDLKSWNKELAKYGLKIREEIREVECLILKEI